MSKNSAKSVVTRVYKVSEEEKALLRSLKVEDETWFDYLERLGQVAATLQMQPKGTRDRSLRLDLPSEIYKCYGDVGRTPDIRY